MTTYREVHNVANFYTQYERAVKVVPNMSTGTCASSNCALNMRGLFISRLLPYISLDVFKLSTLYLTESPLISAFQDKLA